MHGTVSSKRFAIGREMAQSITTKKMFDYICTEFENVSCKVSNNLQRIFEKKKLTGS